MTVNRVNARYLGGFRLDNTVCGINIVSMNMAAVAISQGDACIDNGAGFVTSTSVTAFVATFVGIAMETVDNSGGSAGDKQILIAIPNTIAQWWVPCETTAAVQTDVGEIADLVSEDGVDVADNSVVAWGFRVDDVDVSTAALANSSSKGFVLGRILPQPQ